MTRIFDRSDYDSRSLKACYRELGDRLSEEAAALRSELHEKHYPGFGAVGGQPVFIARGTHAAYPLPCTQDSCDNGTPFEDNEHDVQHAWPERSCSASCVTAFPTTADGTSPGADSVRHEAADAPALLGSMRRSRPRSSSR